MAHFTILRACYFVLCWYYCAATTKTNMAATSKENYGASYGWVMFMLKNIKETRNIISRALIPLRRNYCIQTFMSLGIIKFQDFSKALFDFKYVYYYFSIP